MAETLDSFKLKIFDSYLKDTGSSYDGFLTEKNLTGADEATVSKEKIKIINEAIEIMGKDELFQNYLSEADFKSYKDADL